MQIKKSRKNPMNRILDEDYLEERFNIFENYTLQSMKEQINQNFTWIILFHKRTPSKYKERIMELKKEFNFNDLYLDDEEKFSFLEYVEKEHFNNDYFITTRIDNDDMFANDYIEQIQQYANTNLHECVLSFEKGKQYDLKTKKEYLYQRKDNHFLSMIGKRDECILQYNHAKIFQSGKEVVMLESQMPMWVEIVHDINVINKIKEEDIE